MFSTLKNISIEEIYWTYKFGKPKKKGTIYDLRASNFNKLETPIFFLSTGRTGTKWFTDLLSNNKSLMLLHSERPDFAIQNNYAYNMYNSDLDNSILLSFIKEIFLTGREQHLRYAYKTEKRFVETNNHITFFAYALSEIFPNSKFVHLYRHPGEFVRSGLRRNWYKEDSNLNQKLITPTNKMNLDWHNSDSITKISWLWNETNSFIENFSQNIDSNRFYSFNFNELNLENVKNLMSFMEISVNESKISKRLNKKSNIQTSGNVAKYKDWNNVDKTKLKNICNTLAQKYGYKL